MHAALKCRSDGFRYILNSYLKLAQTLKNDILWLVLTLIENGISNLKKWGLGLTAFCPSVVKSLTEQFRIYTYIRGHRIVHFCCGTRQLQVNWPVE